MSEAASIHKCCGTCVFWAQGQTADAATFSFDPDDEAATRRLSSSLLGACQINPPALSLTFAGAAFPVTHHERRCGDWASSWPEYDDDDEDPDDPNDGEEVPVGPFAPGEIVPFAPLERKAA